jgi:hypothetical protein
MRTMAILLCPPLLLFDPGALLFRERNRLALRAPARNRYAHGSVRRYAD